MIDEFSVDFLFKIAVMSLLGWRLTILLVFEDGPFDVLAKFRDRIGIKYDEFSIRTANNTLAKLFNCPRCTSIWVGWLVSFLFYGTINMKMVVLGLVLSAIIILIQEKVKLYEG